MNLIFDDGEGKVAIPFETNGNSHREPAPLEEE